MDAEGRIIEVVEDDMGEGFKDEAPRMSIKDMLSRPPDPDQPKAFEPQEFIKAAKQMKPQPPPIPPRLKMREGMIIHFYGYDYKVKRVRPNGTVVLKFIGLTPPRRS